MRKFLLPLMLLILLCLCSAAQAEVFTFDAFSATCEISDSKYTILTPDNLAEHADFLEKQGTTAEALLADWNGRGVVLQAWTKSGDACLEISAVQDDFAAQYYDVNQVTDEERKEYRLGHSSDKTGYWRAMGYDYSSAQWKNTTDTGRFLQLQYSRTVGGETWRGYARKTIRNGYHIQLDYQVFGRSLKNADKNALDDVMDTWEFLEVWPRPVNSASTLFFSVEPPRETNTGKFTLEGSGTPGVHIIGVAVRMSSSDVQRFEATVGKNGKFEMDVKLPSEGIWMMTYTAESGTSVVEEGAFKTITYQKSLLTVSLNTELPPTLELNGNELVLSGKTMAKTKVQCIVDGRYDKQITTNNSGSFSFTIDTGAEGNYNITLVFEKKDYATRRFYCEATRTYTETDRRQHIREEAVKPSYTNLVKKISGYTGDYMVYTLHVRSVDPIPTGYLAFAGMKKSKSGVYSNIVVIRSSENPVFSAGDEVKMYLKCIGTYQVVSDEGTEEYPYFDLQFVE